MKTIKTKNKLKIIYTIVAVVMAIRCIKTELILEDNAFIPKVCCMVLYIGFLIWGYIVIDYFDRNNSNQLFVVLILFTILSISILIAEDYVASMLSVVFIIGIYILLYIASRQKSKSVLITCIIMAIVLFIGSLIIWIRECNQIMEFKSFPSIYFVIMRILITLLLTLPFIVLFVKAFAIVLDRAKTKPVDFKLYKLWLFGGVLVVPLFFMGNNYGTWFFAFFSYYLIGIIGLIIANDEIVTSVLSDMFKVIREKCAYLILLLIYAVMFTPIDSVKVCTFVDNFINWDL